MKIGVLTLLLVGSLMVPTTVAANAGPFLPNKVFGVSPGFTLGVAPTLGSGPGFFLGGELSVFYWRDAWFGGVVGDLIHDYHRGTKRFMVGPMFGFAFVGIDGGYLGEITPDGLRHGLAIRLFATIAVGSLYFRYGGVFDARDYVEVGLLLKIPIPIWSRGRPRGRPPRPPDRPGSPGVEGTPPPEGKPEPTPAPSGAPIRRI